MKVAKLFGDHGPELTAFPDPVRDLGPGDSQARTAILAGGCFWCTEAVFLPRDGVTGVTSGYSGAASSTANYEAVCAGPTGHAKAIAGGDDPAVISYGQLLKVFFAVAHDPTQLNRQGADRGTQYRSAIFPADDAQRDVAQAYIAQLTAAQVFPDPIVTTIDPGTFYPAEIYHQNFVARNPAQPYVAAVALPKVAKLQAAFPDKLRGR
jgi:peptide-methionine (S)-S-oxide reductase